MGPVYRFLGMTRGRHPQWPEPCGQEGCPTRADITYGTNNEFGFDYLRDNLAFRREDQMQRALAYAIVDEVDSILIDEARTPLIISGPSDESSELYIRINKLIPRLKVQEVEDGPGDYSVDEKTRQAYLTEDGHQKVEELLAREGLLAEGDSLYDAANIRLMHHLTAGLRAHALYKRDVEYIVKDGEIVIVDEFTGRTMPGRRWSDGLHQAIEAKEGVNVKEENQTVASITFQNYFRMYEKLAGMTGTADTEAFEFQQIYGLEVVVIPTHKDDDPRGPSGSGVPDAEGQVRRRSSRTSATAGSASSRCWSARRPSRPPSTSPGCSPRTTCRTRCSTPSSTSGRPGSSPMPAGRAP